MLAPAERTAVLEVLHAPEFVDLAPGQVYAQLLDAERYVDAPSNEMVSALALA
jgi:putative transposase